MRLTIKNAEAAYIKHASQPNRLDVDIDGIGIEDILREINITGAIEYYGITELFDTIGEAELRSYLDDFKRRD